MTCILMLRPRLKQHVLLQVTVYAINAVYYVDQSAKQTFRSRNAVRSRNQGSVSRDLYKAGCDTS